jgi:hypothetical protein
MTDEVAATRVAPLTVKGTWNAQPEVAAVIAALSCFTELLRYITEPNALDDQEAVQRAMEGIHKLTELLREWDVG